MGLYLPKISHVETETAVNTCSTAICGRTAVRPHAEAKPCYLPREPLHISLGSDSFQRDQNWFGGNYKEAGYTTRGIDSILTVKKRATRATYSAYWLDSYSEHFRDISVARACCLLTRFGCGGDTFLLDGFNMGCSKRKTTPSRLYSFYVSAPLWPARKLAPVEFIGGPPGKLGGYKGTFLTMLLDRVVTIALLEGVKTLNQLLAPPDKGLTTSLQHINL